MSSSSLVLITGATGHLGFKTLLDALKAGYKVRAAVRSESKKATILNNPVFKASNIPAEQLSFVIVEDLAAPGAYDKAVQGVDYVIHIASPITTGRQMNQAEYEKYFIEPAVQGTVGMLKSAAKSSSVKRIVITSSIVAIIKFSEFTNTNGRVVYANERIPDNHGPFQAEFEAYSASKSSSLNSAEKWYKENKPSYDVVYINPAFIEGRNDLILSAKDIFEGTNAVVLGAATGKEAGSTVLPSATVHNDDVARLHVEALNPKIPAGSYNASWNADDEGNNSRWEEINSIVAKNFPEQVESGLLPNKGRITGIPQKFDSRKTEEVFGWKLQSFEEQVKSVVGHYIELSSKA
jgi:nucleoside-diphosphate-sugar epimerase